MKKDQENLNDISRVYENYSRIKVNEANIASSLARIEKLELRIEKGFISLEESFNNKHKIITEQLENMTNSFDKKYQQKWEARIYFSILAFIGSVVLVGVISNVISLFFNNVKF